MPLGNRRSYASKATVSESSTEDSDISSGKSTPPDERSSSTSSKDLYHKSRLPSRQFWMAVSSTKLSDLMGFAFKHGRPWAVAQIARMMHSEYVFCGFVAPFRGFLFSVLHYELDQRLLSDLTACALSMDPVVRNVSLLEVLLVLLQSREATHEFEPLTNYADSHLITKETGYKADPVLAVFLGYIAAYRIRELCRLQLSEEGAGTEFQEITLENLRQKIRPCLKAALCVPNVAADVFLELAQNYAAIDEEFNFEQVLKTFINRNPQHLSGFYFYLKILRERSDADSKVRRLATMRKIIHFSPADEAVLEYAEAILALGEIADVQDVASRLAQNLEHWDCRRCLKGWMLLCSALVYGRKYGRPVEIMSQREFWWEYHFVCLEEYDTVDMAKALFVSIIIHDSHEYVCSVRNDAKRKQDMRFEAAYSILNDVSSFEYGALFSVLNR